MTLVLFRHSFLAALVYLCVGITSQTATAQSVDPFENGWSLNAESSQLRFLSIKKGNLVETHSFAAFSGQISEDGEAKVRVLLDSVDTKIDLRNVRMRFLFFETFLYPEATITTQLDPGVLTNLHTVGRKLINLNFTLSLHGVNVDRTAQVAVTLISNDRIAVSTTTPIVLTLSEFNLNSGLEKLQEAANVTIVPLGIVSFDFVFDRSSPGTPPKLATATKVIASILTADEVGRSLQEALKQRGCYAGSIDGILGRNSKKGLAEFARQAGVPISLPRTPDTEQLGAVLDIVRAFPDASCPRVATVRPSSPQPTTTQAAPHVQSATSPTTTTTQSESGSSGYYTRRDSTKLVPRTSVDCFGPRAKFYDCD